MTSWNTYIQSHNVEQACEDLLRAMADVVEAQGDGQLQVYVTDGGIRALTPEEAKTDASAKRMGVPSLKNAVKKDLQGLLSQADNERATRMIQQMKDLARVRFSQEIKIRSYDRHNPADSGRDQAPQAQSGKLKRVTFQSLVEDKKGPLTRSKIEEAWLIQIRVAAMRCIKALSIDDKAPQRQIKSKEAAALEAVIQELPNIGRIDAEFFDEFCEHIRTFAVEVEDRVINRLLPYITACFREALDRVEIEAERDGLEPSKALERLQDLFFQIMEEGNHTADKVTREEFRRMAGEGIEIESELQPKIDISNPNTARLMHDYRSGSWQTGQTRLFETTYLPDSYAYLIEEGDEEPEEASYASPLIENTLLDPNFEKAIIRYFSHMQKEM